MLPKPIIGRSQASASLPTGWYAKKIGRKWRIWTEATQDEKQFPNYLSESACIENLISHWHRSAQGSREFQFERSLFDFETAPEGFLGHKYDPSIDPHNASPLPQNVLIALGAAYVNTQEEGWVECTFRFHEDGRVEKSFKCPSDFRLLLKHPDFLGFSKAQRELWQLYVYAWMIETTSDREKIHTWSVSLQPSKKVRREFEKRCLDCGKVKPRPEARFCCRDCADRHRHWIYRMRGSYENFPKRCLKRLLKIVEKVEL